MDNRSLNPSFIWNNETFDELTKYLKSEDKDKLQLNNYSPEHLEEITQLIHQADWLSISKINDFPLYALFALKEKKISGMEFSTSQIFYNTLTHVDNKNQTEIIPLFNQQGELNPRAEWMIDETMKFFSDSNDEFAKQTIIKLKNTIKPNLFSMFSSLPTVTEIQTWETYLKISAELAKESDWTPQERQQFFFLIKTLPLSEQYFLLIQDDFDAAETVTRRINFGLGFNPLSRLLVNEKPMIMIPSKGMMQSYLYATRGNLAPHLVSRLCLSTWRGAYETMKHNGRDLYISFKPLLHLEPKLVDTYASSSRSAEAEKHDGIYHAARFADIPLLMRQFYFEIIDALWPTLTCSSPSKTTLTQLFTEAVAKRIIDMENTAYDRRFRNNVFISKLKLYGSPKYKAIFPKDLSHYLYDNKYPLWKSINSYMEQALSALKRRPSCKKKVETEIVEAQWIVARKMVIIFIANEEEWHRKYNFSIAELFLAEKVYNSFLKLLTDAFYTHIYEVKSKSLPELELFIQETSCLYLRDEAERELIKIDLKNALAFSEKIQSASLANKIYEKFIKNFDDYMKEDLFIRLLNTYPTQLAFVVKTAAMMKYDLLFKKIREVNYLNSLVLLETACPAENIRVGLEVRKRHGIISQNHLHTFGIFMDNRSTITNTNIASDVKRIQLN